MALPQKALVLFFVIIEIWNNELQETGDPTHLVTADMRARRFEPIK
jgi:hypothetical protein